MWSAPSAITISARVRTAPRTTMRLLVSRRSGCQRRWTRAGAAAAGLPTSSGAVTASGIFDPWVEEGVEQVDYQVDEHEGDRDHQHRALDDRVGAAVDRIEQQ